LATRTHRSIKIQHEASFNIFFSRLAATPITSWSQIRKFGVGVMQNSSFFQFYLTDERFGIQISVKYRHRIMHSSLLGINIRAFNILFKWFTRKLTAISSYQVFQKKVKHKKKRQQYIHKEIHPTLLSTHLRLYEIYLRWDLPKQLRLVQDSMYCWEIRR